MEDKELVEGKTILSIVDDNYVKAVNIITSTTGKVIITGMGKSGHIGCKIAATMASTGTQAYFVHPSEASHGDLGMISKNDCVIAISNSGESITKSSAIFVNMTMVTWL